ncbi:MAG: hypothetical protein K9N55_20695 [Phycisphaerae bacterium]|nr:hypothetical protein [Phycisphaerae bacterium]
MAKETYQPKKFKRSRYLRARWIRRLWGLLVVIVIYVLITQSLDRLDDTPGWARVSFPLFAVQGASYVVDVRYFDLPKNSSIRAKMTMVGQEFQSLGGLNVEQEVYKTRGTVMFPFPMPNDPNASFIDFTITCDDLSKSQGTEPKSEIRSGRIAILPPDHAMVLRAYNRPGWQNVMADAIKGGYWSTNRGDPTVIGWSITVFYAVAALACLYCTGFCDSRRSVPISLVYAWFWWMMLGLVVMMGINKQLDVQLLLADIGRAFTKHLGWYGQRKPVQIRVLAFGACVCLACLLEVGHKLKRAPKSTWLALFGILLLGVNVLIHLVSLHLIEGVLAYSLAGLSVGNGLEIVCILWILISALVYNRAQRDRVCYIIQ